MGPWGKKTIWLLHEVENEKNQKSFPLLFSFRLFPCKTHPSSMNLLPLLQFWWWGWSYLELSLFLFHLLRSFSLFLIPLFSIPAKSCLPPLRWYQHSTMDLKLEEVLLLSSHPATAQPQRWSRSFIFHCEKAISPSMVELQPVRSRPHSLEKLMVKEETWSNLWKFILLGEIDVCFQKFQICISS